MAEYLLFSQDESELIWTGGIVSEPSCIYETEHEVTNFPSIFTQQSKTLAHRLNEKTFVSNQVSVIKRNVINKHNLRKDNLADLPLDIETQSQVLSQDEKTTITEADFQNPQLQTVISSHESSGPIEKYCERSTVIASVSGETTQSYDTSQSFMSHDPRAVLYHFYNRRSKYGVEVKQTVADRLINVSNLPQICMHGISKPIDEDTESNILPMSLVEISSNRDTKDAVDNLKDIIEHSISNPIELDEHFTKTTVRMPLKKRQRMMEVPYNMGHALNKSVLKINFSLEEEFLLVDYMVEVFIHNLYSHRNENPFQQNKGETFVHIGARIFKAKCKADIPGNESIKQ